MSERAGVRAGVQAEPIESHPGQRYLALAAGLAGTQSSRHFAVSHVTIGAVAAAAGVSRGALYRLWPSQQDFWNDLIDFLEECPRRRGEDGPRRPSPRSQSFSDAAQDILLADTLTLLRTATADMGVPNGDESRVGERRGARLGHLATALERAVVAAGRQFSPAVSPSDLAAAVTALGIGLPVAGRMCAAEDLRFDSPWFEPPSNGARSVLGVATEAIRDHMTRVATSDAAPERIAMPAREHGATAGERTPPPAGRRRSYLEIGARLAMTRDGTAAHRVLGHVTLDSVARAAGVTRRTVASVWPDQDAFRLDLFTHLLREDRAAIIAAIREATVRHDSSQPSIGVFEEVGSHLHRSLVSGLGGPTFRAYAVQLDEPSLAARAIEEHRRLTESCVVHVQRLLAMTNRRLRSGVVGRQLAAVLFALTDGFATLLRTSPGAVREDIHRDDDASGARTQTLIGITVGAVLDVLTEPLDGSDDVNRYVSLIS
jgi:AcrR family transcriptional regulator